MRLYLFPVLGILTSSVLAQPMGHWDDEFPLGINGSQTPPISPEHMIHVFDGQQGRIVLLAEETIQVPHPNFCPDLSFPPGTFHYRSRTYLWTPPAPGGEPTAACSSSAGLAKRATEPQEQTEQQVFH
jgi:hypothetical protein